MIQQGKVKYLTKQEADALLQECKDQKYRVIILLMMDSGLRVSEAVRLQAKHFDFKERVIKVQNLKKRNEETYRTVPMTNRLIQDLSKYWVQLPNTEPHSYLFPPGSKLSEQDHLSRKTVWKRLKKLDKALHPHLLRHTYATRLIAEGIALLTIKELLGHSSTAVTEIYTHLNTEQLRQAVQTIEPRESRWKKWYNRLLNRKTPVLMPVMKGSNQFIVGRQKELTDILDLASKHVNVLILGEQGSGKTHLLDNLKLGHQKIMRIDEMSTVKKTLIGMLLELFSGDKEEIATMLYGDEDFGKRITRESIKNLTDLLIQVTAKYEYTIIVDDVTAVPPNGVKVLEKLRNHFHLIVAARKIPISKATFLTNFQTIRLQSLSRPETLLLIKKLSTHFKESIEDYELYRNHIWQQTQGNPQFTCELVERYRKEPLVTVETVRDIRHTAALKEIDMSVPLLIGLSSLMVLRYVGQETGDSSLKLIGGIFMVFALFARSIFRAGKRKYV